MKVKVKMIAAVLMAGLFFVGTASAYDNRGGAYHHGQMKGGPVFQQVDQATQNKIETFWSSNQSLQKEMIMKNAERQALVNAATPDPVAIAKITGELFDLRSTLMEKAKAEGINKYIGYHAMTSGQTMHGHRSGGYGHH